MPTISVIIPTYNRSEQLREAVNGILKQTFTDFEVLVIDDGSTDDTPEVIKQISDNRIKYFYKVNGGASSARNLGLTKAQGQYIALLDDDDLWPENYLAAMIDKMEENKDYGLAYALFKIIVPDGSLKAGFKPERYFSGWLTQNFFGTSPCINPSATIFRQSTRNGMFFDEFLKSGDDYDFFLRLSAKTKFLCVPDIFVTRRIRTDGLSKKAGREFSPNLCLILERFYFYMEGGGKISRFKAMYKIGSRYRRLARSYFEEGYRIAAIKLLKKAIGYYPYEPQYYKELLKALLLSEKNDKMPNWQMPKPLPTYITITQSIRDSTQCR